MEHFCLPSGQSIGTYERVLYVAEGYDNDKFLSYPNRSRFWTMYNVIVSGKINLAASLQASRYDKNELETFIQTWLVFGLIHEVFGPTATPEKFITGRDNESLECLTAARLPEVVKIWKDGYNEYSVNQSSEARFHHLLQCFGKAQQFLNMVSQGTTKYTPVMRAAALICGTIELVVQSAYEPETTHVISRWSTCFDTSSTYGTVLALAHNGTSVPKSIVFFDAHDPMPLAYNTGSKWAPRSLQGRVARTISLFQHNLATLRIWAPLVYVPLFQLSTAPS